MKILILSQYFRPETGAGSERVSSLADYLTAEGHLVRVISGLPNYPTGILYPGYKLVFWKREEAFGIKITRSLVFPTKYSSTIRRLTNYFSFMFSAFLTGLFETKSDVIIASSPPLTVGLVGLLLSYLYRKPLVFEPRDVWPGAAVELGVLKNKLIISVARSLERAIYKRASFIITPTAATKKILLADNPFLTEDRVKVSANSVDLERFDSQRIASTIVDKYKKPSNFLIVYTGTIGLQQGMSTLIGAAKLLKNEKQILFLLVGEGVDKEKITKEKEKFNLTNIILSPSVDYSEIPSILAKADAGLALLKKNRYQDAALAVKTFDYMAAGKPIIVSGGETMRKLVEENKVGFWSPPEDSGALVRQILGAAKSSKETLKALGDNGRSLVEKTYNKKKQVEAWNEVLDSLKKEKK